MTTQIFFNNQTAVHFVLSDIDHNRFPLIAGGNIFSLHLHYSDSWETQYSLTLSNGKSVYFWLDKRGEIGRIDVSSGIALLNPANVGNDRGSPINSVIILPNGKSLPYAPTRLLPPIGRALLYANDY